MTTPLPPKAVIDTHIPTGTKIYGYTADQIRDYGAAEYKRGIEAAATEFDRRATLPDGTKLEGFYEPDEPAEIIRKLGETS